MPAKQDQQAARERRARIHRSILDRWNHVTRPLGWAVENEPDSANDPLQQNSCGAVGSHAEHAGDNLETSNLAGFPPSAAVVGAGSELEAGERGRAGEPLLSVAANVAGNLKEGLREESLMCLRTDRQIQQNRQKGPGKRGGCRCVRVSVYLSAGVFVPSAFPLAGNIVCRVVELMRVSCRHVEGGMES